MEVSEKIYGKVNLWLRIEGVAPNGYHLLDTAMTNVNCYDLVEARPRSDKSVNITYKCGSGFTNDLALKAANAVIKKFNTNGADFFITKGIPVAAGLGGSSATQAGVVKCMQRLYSFKADNAFLLSLGSDVPYMYQGGYKRVKGLGDIVESIDSDPPFAVAVCDPSIEVSTAECFKLYDKLVDSGQWTVNSGLTTENRQPSTVNFLEKAACTLNNRITELKKLVESAGFENVVLSGSGGAIAAYGYCKQSFLKALQRLTACKGQLAVFDNLLIN
jgi:4-diphosphocytidyl-2-C-methyl-D-erythritol kinase